MEIDAGVIDAERPQEWRKALDDVNRGPIAQRYHMGINAGIHLVDTNGVPGGSHSDEKARRR